MSCKLTTCPSTIGKNQLEELMCEVSIELNKKFGMKLLIIESIEKEVTITGRKYWTSRVSTEPRTATVNLENAIIDLECVRSRKCFNGVDASSLSLEHSGIYDMQSTEDCIVTFFETSPKDEKIKEIDKDSVAGAFTLLQDTYMFDEVLTKIRPKYTEQLGGVIPKDYFIFQSNFFYVYVTPEGFKVELIRKDPVLLKLLSHSSNIIIDNFKLDVVTNPRENHEESIYLISGEPKMFSQGWFYTDSSEEKSLRSNWLSEVNLLASLLRLTNPTLSTYEIYSNIMAIELIWTFYEKEIGKEVMASLTK